MSGNAHLDPPYLYPDYRSTLLRAPKEPLLELPQGALDVPGPLVPRGFVRAKDNDLTAHGKAAPRGERMVLAGRLIDADGHPIRAALVEIWHVSAPGPSEHPG